MKAASLPWQWLRFSLLYPWGHSTCPFSITGCAGEKSKQCGTLAGEPTTSVLPAPCPSSRGERVLRPALDGLLMTPRAEGKVGAATLSMQCLLLLGKCQPGDPEVLPVPHTYHCVTLSPSRSVRIARWHMTRGIRVKGMAEVLDKLLK